jgi:hypothetical protein
MKYKYTGTDERVFPSLGIVVKPNEEFEAPENFHAADVISVGSSKPFVKPAISTSSAASDTKVGE